MDRSFLEETVRFWQPRYSRPFTQEDARQAIANVNGFFTLLREWSAETAQLSSPDRNFEEVNSESHKKAPKNQCRDSARSGWRARGRNDCADQPPNDLEKDSEWIAAGLRVS